jgi:F-type H+-transporting ATPase subunit delta
MNETLQELVRELQGDASAQRIARVYAEALLEGAQKQNLTEEIQQDLEGLLRDVAGSDPLMRNFFLGGVVGRGARKEALEKAFAGRVNEIFLNFLLVLNDHDRLELLGPIIGAYEKLMVERSGKVVVRVRSAVPLADEYRERLVQQLAQMTRREPILETSVDPSLLGGLVVRVGDYVYDASVRTRLATLRNQLIERSSHAIQTGRDRFSSAV